MKWTEAVSHRNEPIRLRVTSKLNTMRSRPLTQNERFPHSHSPKRQNSMLAFFLTTRMKKKKNKMNKKNKKKNKNMWTGSSGVSIQRRHWQPLQPMMWMMWCVVWRLTTPLGLRPLLFSKGGVGSFTFHKNQVCVSAVRRTYSIVFVLIRED